jgi:hypothetical protein
VGWVSSLADGQSEQQGHCSRAGGQVKSQDIPTHLVEGTGDPRGDHPPDRADKGEDGRGSDGLLGRKEAAKGHRQRYPGPGRQPSDGPARKEAIGSFGGTHEPGTQSGKDDTGDDKRLAPAQRVSSNAQRQADESLPQPVLRQNYTHQGKVLAFALDVGRQGGHVEVEGHPIKEGDQDVENTQ